MVRFVNIKMRDIWLSGINRKFFVHRKYGKRRIFTVRNTKQSKGGGGFFVKNRKDSFDIIKCINV